MRQAYKVAAVSSNRNSFGLRGVVLIALDGEAWEVGANDTHILKRGDTVMVDNRSFATHGFEIPHRLTPDAPSAVVNELWKEGV